MKREEANRINSLVKNIDNITTLLGELMMPLNALMQKNNCTKEQACNIKMKAEDFLQKYGVFTLSSTTNSIKAMTNQITERH